MILIDLLNIINQLSWRNFEGCRKKIGMGLEGGGIIYKKKHVVEKGYCT